jgi:hypothetical protein
MAKKAKFSFQKRQRELNRMKKRSEKEARRQEAKERKAQAKQGIGEEDPDIAGIQPGPQALPEQWDDDADDADDAEEE